MTASPFSPPRLPTEVRQIRPLFRRLLFWLAVLPAALPALADEAANRFFETEVRPLLAARCGDCHGAEKQSGGMRADSRASLIEGGESGPAIVPGEVEASLMIQAVRRQGGLEMPPEEKLTGREIAALSRWIEMGAPWPDSPINAPAAAGEQGTSHWAFQPVRPSALPPVANADWVRTPIDAFVLARLTAAGLAPAPEADRRTLLRRASYALTGLPPSPREVAEFVSDPDPAAYERLIDRLLSSPHYGEQWARHWLDVARYSDTKGYVYAREERFWVHAWSYRDWVVRALNADLPYDRFLLLQLAADRVSDRGEGDLAAMGFLTLGRRFLGVKHDIIDDRIDVVCRGTMGLSVACARCHDHKYDPIPTADYYSLYGVFDSSLERLVPLARPAAENMTPEEKAFYQQLSSRQESLNAKMAACRAEASDRARERVAGYLRAQTELHKYPADGFDQIFEKTDLLPAVVRRWEARLRGAERRGDPVFTAWHAYAALPEETFAQQANEVTQRLQSAGESVNPLIAAAFREPPASFADVADRYGAVFTEIDQGWKASLAEAAAAGADPPVALPDPAAEQLRSVLYGPDAPCEIPDEPIVHTETFFDSGSVTQLWKLQGEVDRWIIQSKLPAPFALTLMDRPVPREPRIFRRGNPLNPGDDVPRKFLSLLAGIDGEPFEQGSGRLELAQAIVDPANPLTARVIVNRVWAHHFGRGLVGTPSDFGARADPPTHPELLDWLAARFIADGWRLKSLHRLILLSATFRQDSAESSDSALLARALRDDPQNRLLWRVSPRRLSFEEFRDSLLAATGELDLRSGGKPAPLLQPPYSARRTLYGLIDRQFLPGTLRMFDFANPDLHVPRRSETTVPQQALFLLNHPLVLQRARTLAAELPADMPPDEKVRVLFQSAYQRDPSETEIAEALAFLASVESQGHQPSSAAADWRYGFGELDEDARRLTGFTPLPHFTGESWQGGAQWPDAALGWVQLTAAGGHPGDDRQHAAVRRWTAPRPMTIEVRSRLVHEAAPGDGIRAFVVSSRGGVLASAAIHNKSIELNSDPRGVAAGETIDFVVDIGEILNSDQFLWQADIVEVAETSDAGMTWNSQSDFPRGDAEQLTPWEQLAHVLLCSNEFLFVD